MLVNRPQIIQSTTAFEKRASVASATISSEYKFIQTAGYTAAGDGGGASYKRVSSEPSHAGKVQDSGSGWWEFFDAIVTLEMFGALGSDASADGTALTNAIAYLNAIGGGTIRGKAGRTYYMTEVGGSPGITTSTPIEIDMNGCTFKRPDDAMTTDFQRMITLALTTTASSLEVRGGIIDANYTGNEPAVAPGSTDFEHNASIFAWVKAAGVPYVKFRDLHLKDRWQFDHLSVYATITNYVHLVTFDGIISETTHSPALRADIIFAENCRNVRIDGARVERIESEFDAAPAAAVTVHIANSTCSEALQLGGNGPTTAPTVKMYLDNVTAAETDLSYVSIYDRQCDFGVVNSWNPAIWRSHDSRFEVIDNGFPTGNAGSLVADFVDLDWYLTRPVFRLESGPQTVGNHAFRFPTVLTAYEDVTIVMEEPDFLDDFGVIGTPRGTVRIIRPKVKQLGSWAFAADGTTGRRVDLTIEGGDYANCTGTPLLLSSFNAAGYKLTLLGDWFGTEGRWSNSGTAHTASLIENHRRIFHTSAPSSGIIGDELHLVPSPTTGAGTYVANNSSTSATLWMPVGRSPFLTFTDQDATPSVSGGKNFKAANTVATTITAFDSGFNGQEINVVFTTANTTIDLTGTALEGNAGVDWTPAANDHMTCIYDGTNWFCRISDNSA